MKKMELSFQAAISDVFFSIGEKRLFCYEQDKEELVNLYGGKNYYISQSGLSGAGFLDFSNRENDLIRLGWYRTDTKQTNEMGSEKISGIEVYVPLNGHNGIADQDPMILVRDNKIGFVQIYDFKGMVTDLVSGFNSLFEIDYKHFETEMFNEIGGKFPFTWELSNICQFRGINCLNFLRLPEIYRQPTADRIRGDFPFTLGKLNIVKFNDENEKPFFLHRMNAIGGEYYDNILHPDDLINPEPTEIAQGFKYDASGFYYRRQYSEILGDECVYAFMEIETPDRYSTRDENEFCEYELEVPLIEFYTTERSIIAKKLKLRIAKKAHLLHR